MRSDVILMPSGRMSFDDYRAIEAENISGILPMQTSAKHYRHAKQNPDKDTTAKRLGRLVHTVLLEPLELMRDYALSPFDDFKTKAAREWKAAQEASGKTVITEAQKLTAELMRDAVNEHPIAPEFLRGGKHEWVIQWIDPATGIKCKARIDYLKFGVALADVKTTRHAKRTAFGRDAANLAYPVRLAFYRDGVRSVYGVSVKVIVIAIENTPPHDVVVYEMPETALEAGRKVYQPLLARIKECKESGRWPGVCEDEVTPIDLPAWAFGAQSLGDESETLTVGGMPMNFGGDPE